MPALVSNQAQPVTGQLLPGQLPSKGINARDTFLEMGPQDAVNLVNFLSDDFGIALRYGYQEFATELSGGVSVPTLMSYYPATAVPGSFVRKTPTSAHRSFRLAQPRTVVTLFGQLLACTNGNIYDITAGGDGPWVAMLGVTMTSDYWTWVNFQNAAGNFLLATNNLGGYFHYNGTPPFVQVAAGVAAGDIDGVDPANLVFLMVWKRRVWFIEKDSTKAWYLPVEQITGTVTAFDFGPQFRHGGKLASLFSWTLDGGEGIDDHLVALSDQGDIVIYKGYDPDTAASDPAAFQLHGVWYIGAVPVGRRQATLYGGDAYILSVYGITQLSKLVSQAQVAANLVEDITSRIDPYISKLMEGDTSELGWYLQFLPNVQMFVVGVPQQLTGEGVLQLAMKIRRSAWSKLLDLPLATMINHDALAFGGGMPTTMVNGGGKVYLLFENGVDNMPLSGTTGSRPIRGRMTPAFSGFGTPGQWKIFPMVRPIIRAAQTPNVKVRALTDYTDSTLFSVPTLPPIVLSLWDIDVWDAAIWGGFLAPFRKWFGTSGCGYAAAVQLDVVGVGGTVVMAIDWWVVPGGTL